MQLTLKVLALLTAIVITAYYCNVIAMVMIDDDDECIALFFSLN